MALINRNGRLYYYRNKRVGGKVKSVYVGASDCALFAANIATVDLLSKKQQWEFQRAKFAEYLKKDNEIKTLETILVELFNVVARANGYHKPKGQWRKKRQN